MKLSYHIPLTSWPVPLVVVFLGLSTWSISLPSIILILSILNPLDLFKIPSTPSKTLCTANWLLYSSLVSKVLHNLPMCTSAGSITNRWESLLLVRFIFGYFGSLAAKLKARQARTVALETGIQNTPLTMAIILSSFPKESQSELMLLPIIYAISIVLYSVVVTIIFRKISSQESIPTTQV